VVAVRHVLPHLVVLREEASSYTSRMVVLATRLQPCCEFLAASGWWWRFVMRSKTSTMGVCCQGGRAALSGLLERTGGLRESIDIAPRGMVT
jgi:hypothetical protein